MASPELLEYEEKDIQKANELNHLLPCPFCGATDPVAIIRTHKKAWLVECSMDFGGCGARAGTGGNPKLAAMIWNRRVR